MNQYDASEDGSDPLAYLDDYTNRNGEDVTEWTWLGQDDAGHDPAAEQAHTGTEFVDGTTVTTDVADVDTSPSADPDGSEQDPPDNRDDDGDSDRDRREDGDGDPDADGPSLTDIGTVSARTASDLRAVGFETVEAVYSAENSALAEAEGFDESKAAFIREQAAKTLGVSGDEIDTESSAESIDTELGGETDEEPTADVDESDDSSTDTGEQDTNTSAHDDESDGLLNRIMSGISPNHPAAGKSRPDVGLIGPVDGQKAAGLRAAGYETALDVYEADTPALAAVDGIDETNADYLQRMAERTLEISDASVSASPDESESEAETETETEPKTEDESGTGDGTAPVESRETAATTEQSSSDAVAVNASETAETATEGGSSAGGQGQEQNGTETTGDASDEDDATTLTLTDIREVGENRADVLRKAGYESVEDVAVVVNVAGRSTLTEIEGIDETCAETIAESANTLLNDQSDGTGAESAGGDE